MRNSKVIREEIGEVKTSLDALENLVSEENRDFSEDEKVSFDTNMERLTELVDELPKVEKEEEIRMKAANLGGSPVVAETKEEKEIVREFSFGKAVRAAYGEKLDGVELEMAQEGQREMNAIGRSANGVVIPSMILNRAVVTENGTSGIEVGNFVDAVYANTILDDLGVTRVSSTSDQRIPVLGAVTTQFEGETDATADGGSAMTKKDLAPLRVASYVDYSKQAAMQHNESLESALRNSIAQSLGAKLEYAVFTDDSANGAYDYLGNGKTPVTNANITNLMMALVEEVQSNNHNRGNLGFAISNDLFSEVYTAAQISGVNPLIIDEAIMGVKAKFSNQIADITNPAVYYGDFSKVMIAQFGGIEILSDPYSGAISGTNRLILNSYFDMKLVQDSAISVGTFG